MKNWYIVQSHSSFENKVAGLIKEEADKAKIAEKFEEIIVPTHDVTEVKRGKRVQRKKKYFPGYVLIKSFDGNGNYSMGIKEQIIFPEINYDKIDKVRGLNITICTTAKNNNDALELLKCFNMPFSGGEEN